MPMTPSLRDGQASASKKPGRNLRPMFEDSNVEDVEQSENNEVRFEEYGIGDADTAEGQARRAEEAFLEEEINELQEEVEDLEPLPTPSEAELGELCRVPSEGQFQFCELVDEDSPELIGFLEEEEDDDEDLSILEEIESEFEDLTEGEGQ